MNENGKFSVWLLPIFFFSVGGLNIVMDCPTTYSTQKPNNVTCTINSTAIASANCTNEPTTVVFIFKNRNNTETQLCSVAYPCGTTGNPESPNSCDCIGKSNDVFTYLFLFQSQDTEMHENGALSCRVCASASLPENFEKCANIQFDSPPSEPESKLTEAVTLPEEATKLMNATKDNSLPAEPERRPTDSPPIEPESTEAVTLPEETTNLMNATEDSAKGTEAEEDSGFSDNIMLGIIAASVALVAMIMVIIGVLIRRKQNKNKPENIASRRESEVDDVRSHEGTEESSEESEEAKNPSSASASSG